MSTIMLLFQRSQVSTSQTTLTNDLSDTATPLSGTGTMENRRRSFDSVHTLAEVNMRGPSLSVNDSEVGHEPSATFGRKRLTSILTEILFFGFVSCPMLI